MKSGIRASGKFSQNTHANLRWAALMVLCLSCVTASAPFVAVEFGGRVIGSPFGWPVGERVNGYFTYESALPPGGQGSSRPNLVIQTEDGGHYEYTSYSFYVYNNHWTETPPFSGHFVYWDALALEFCFTSCFAEGRGWLSLMSSNTSLFTNDLLPPTIPALEQFDIGRMLSLTPGDIEEGATLIQIDRLLNVPGSGLGRPLIFGARRTQVGVSFQFLTEASTRYVVEFKNNLADGNWATLTNIASAWEPIVTINDEPGLGQRFYRIRKN